MQRNTRVRNGVQRSELELSPVVVPLLSHSSAELM